MLCLDEAGREATNRNQNHVITSSHNLDKTDLTLTRLYTPGAGSLNFVDLSLPQRQASTSKGRGRGCRRAGGTVRGSRAGRQIRQIQEEHQDGIEENENVGVRDGNDAAAQADDDDDLLQIFEGIRLDGLESEPVIEVVDSGQEGGALSGSDGYLPTTPPKSPAMDDVKTVEEEVMIPVNPAVFVTVPSPLAEELVPALRSRRSCRIMMLKCQAPQTPKLTLSLIMILIIMPKFTKKIFLRLLAATTMTHL